MIRGYMLRENYGEGKNEQKSRTNLAVHPAFYLYIIENAF
jgi:hypothetical protein